MLHQNWFCKENMVMFNEYFDKQYFYDTNADCFYVVSEEHNTPLIVEHSKGSSGYIRLMKEYITNKCWKKNSNGDEYYVSPKTGHVYMFYSLKGMGKRKDTAMIACMLEYQSEKVMFETENITYTNESEEPITQELVRWQYATGDNIPKDDFEAMIEEYEVKCEVKEDVLKTLRNKMLIDGYVMSQEEKEDLDTQIDIVMAWL